MPKKGSRRRFNLRKVRSSPAQALGTLAAVTVIATDMVPDSDGEYTVVSAEYTHGITGLTAGEGPITIGVAHSDYSVTEIKECVEAQASISLGDKVAQEQSNRLVRLLGRVTAEEPNLNNGSPVKTKLNWKMTIGDQLVLFAYNDMSSALTTGAIQNAMGHQWIRDR